LYAGAAIGERIDAREALGNEISLKPVLFPVPRQKDLRQDVAVPILAARVESELDRGA
jgi:hypothetical protein